jgi:putative membrane protein
MEMQGWPSRRLGGAERLGARGHPRRMLQLSVVTVVSTLVVIGPVGAAEAHTASRTTSVARAAAPVGGVTLEAEGGPLTAADRDFVTKVRLAGLWEIPASKLAMKKGVAPRVREIGQMISAQHVQLDLLARKAAAEVSVGLPNVPTAEQRRWIDEMKDANGTDFDDVYIERLRAAHGKIFPVIGLIRAGTQNDTVRELAQRTNAFVLTHLTLLESTGLVRYENLPRAAAPAAGPIANAANRSAQEGGLPIAVIWLLLATAVVVAGIFASRIIRPQDFGGRRTGRARGGSGGPIDTRSVPVRSVDDFYPEEGSRMSRGHRSHR